MWSCPCQRRYTWFASAVIMVSNGTLGLALACLLMASTALVLWRRKRRKELAFIFVERVWCPDMSSSSMDAELPISRRFFKVMIDDFRAELVCLPMASLFSGLSLSLFPFFFWEVSTSTGKMFWSEQRIPPAFSCELKGEKTEEAILTSYKGSWLVEVGTCGEHFHFKEGWAEFADGHDLHEGYFLVFEHEGNMRFYVVVFDTSACEKRLRERSGRQGDYSDHHVKLLKQEADCEEEPISLPVVRGNSSRNYGKQLKGESLEALYDLNGGIAWSQMFLPFF